MTRRWTVEDPVEYAVGLAVVGLLVLVLRIAAALSSADDTIERLLAEERQPPADRSEDRRDRAA